MQLTSDRIKISKEQKNTILSEVADHLEDKVREVFLEFGFDEYDCTFGDLRDELLEDIEDPDDRSNVFSDALREAADFIYEDFLETLKHRGLRNRYPDHFFKDN